MADGGSSPKHKENARIKWNLLLSIKSTVEVLLASRNADIWSTYGGLTRIVEDLERIFRHELKCCMDFFGEQSDYDIVLKNAGLLGIKYTGKTWIKDNLLQHTFVEQLKDILGSEQYANEYYKESAFLRSAGHCQALFVCLQAIESNNPDILTQLNNIMDHKGETFYKDFEERESNRFSESWDIAQVYESAENSHNNEKKTLSACYYGGEDERNAIKDSVSQNELNELKLETFYDEDDEVLDIKDGASLTKLVEDHDIVLAKEKLHIKELKLVDFKKKKRNIDEGTLAQVALTAVMEGDERCAVSPSSCWFEGNSNCVQRKRSTSLNEADLKELENEMSLETETKANIDSEIPSRDNLDLTAQSSEFKAKKSLGHSRSKSDGTRLIKSTKRQQSVKEVRLRIKEENKLIDETKLRLSSSLPESSAEFYHNDPLSPDEGVTSFASMLAIQDLSSCELEKENAHFSISEALIQAIEQMKCDQIIASDDEDEDEDDEEIQHLKLEIERRRLEKKREKLQLQPAFSNETPKTASNSDNSSSKSSIIDVDDIDPDWEEISADHIANLSNFSVSETTLVPETNSFLDISSIEASASPPLSAEAVAKSLLQKFANKKHPAASELQWLVSENDVPQTLLPLPKAFSVDPEEAVRNADDVHERRKSLPCRMRGNFEWAPPRFQIIFHVPPQPRRRQQMSEQNYRCIGCGMQVDPSYMKRFRYCHYLGKYFCSSCHNNALMVIPARVVRRWDFKKYEVSKFAHDLLNKIHTDPLFNIKDLNSTLYQKVRILENIKNLRKQLYFFKSFAQTCRKSEHLQEEFSRIPNHLLTEEHLYSLQDLLQVKSGELPAYFKSLVSKCLIHIDDCPLCQAKGFICEYCRDGDDIIFPYDLEKVIQCPNCRASFHKDCYVEGKCPKCERIQIRKSLVAAPYDDKDS